MRHHLGSSKKPEGDNKKSHRPMSKRLMLLLGKTTKSQDPQNKKK